MPTDKNNNVYMLEFGGTRIGSCDAKTNVSRSTDADRRARGRAAAGSTTRTGSGSRNIGGNAIGMFDPKTEKIKEWQLPNAVERRPMTSSPTKDGPKSGPARC